MNVENSKLKHGDSRFSYKGPVSGLYIYGSDLRIAQLLDKLKDNALEFSDENGVILFELKQLHDQAVISVVNSGPAFSEDIKAALFGGMVSSRQGKQNKPHLGIGLFIANRIAEQHRAELKIDNSDNGEGVRASLVMPLSD